MKKLRLTNIITKLLALLFLSNCGLAQHSKITKAGDLIIEKDKFKTGYDFSTDVESGWFGVTENRSKANEKIIKLPFVRFKTNSPNPDLPIIYLSGGPGDSGIDAGKSRMYWMFDEFRNNSDVVLFDQRGTGGSIPDLRMKGRLNLPLDEPLDSEASDQALKKTIEEMDEFLKENEIDPLAYNTLENANDVKELIKALGYEKAHVIAMSYGTHLALALMKYFPEVVGKVVLLGANGLDQRWRSPKNLQSQLEILEERIKNDDSFSSSYPSFLTDVYEVLEELEKEPKVVEIKVGGKQELVTIGKLDLEVLHTLTMGSTSNTANMPKTYREAMEGNFQGIAKGLVSMLKRRPIGTVMTYLTSSASGVSDSRAQKIKKDIKEGPFGDAMNYPFNRLDFQSLLHSDPLPPEFREPFTSEIQTLIVSGDMDVRISLEDVDEIRSQLTNSHHVVVPGVSHSSLTTLEGSASAFSKYFLSGEVPETLGRKRDYLIRLPKVESDQLVAAFRKDVDEIGIEGAITRMNESPVINFFVVAEIAGVYLSNKKFKESYHVYKVGTKHFPQSEFLVLYTALSLNRADKDEIQLMDGNRLVDNKKRAYELYLKAKSMDDFLYSGELEKLAKKFK